MLAATLIGIAGGTASLLVRRRSPAEHPPPVPGAHPIATTPIRVLDVGIRTPAPQPVPLGPLERVVLSPLALLAALVRLHRRLNSTGRRPDQHPPGSAPVPGPQRRTLQRP